MKLKLSNEECAKLASRFILPTYSRMPIALVKGKGSKVWDADGKEYLDFFAGLAVDNLGHAPPAVRRAIADQAGKLLHCSNLFHIREQAELAKVLTKLSGLHQAFFCNSGAEAVEAAIKFSRFYSIKKKGEGSHEIIVAHNSFHGRTLGALSATQQAKYQAGFGPLVPGFVPVPFNDLSAIQGACGPKTAAVLLETIQGEGGVHLPASGFFLALRKFCTEKGILLILDEVQTGMGRTGKLFGYQNYGILPDLVAMSKALGSGFPIGATLVSEEVARSVTPGMHASTFGGNPLACRAALATLAAIAKPSFLSSVQKRGKFLLKGLEGLKRKYPVIREVRGMGLMVACTLASEVGGEIVSKALARGLLINAIQGKILRFIPPLV
ncbi:MAG: aspartate aminotransferase family protein, partial [Deltaproteobacteria bacterium]|nr:aspartate aminotransferase family protein [Deltaproteobacteria bacterium]